MTTLHFDHTLDARVTQMHFLYKLGQACLITITRILAVDGAKIGFEIKAQMQKTEVLFL